MRRLAVPALLVLAACGGGSGDDSTPAATEPPAPVGTLPAEVTTEAPPTAPAPTEPADEPAAPGPGDAVGVLTGPDLDIAVVGRCTYDASDLTSADIAFADVRGLDPSGVEIPARFSLSGSRDFNTQLNINGTQVVTRWSERGLLEQSTDDGSYVLDTTIGRLVVNSEGYELNISCFER